MAGALINIFTFRVGGYSAGALIWQGRLLIFLLLGGGVAYSAGVLIQQGRLFSRGAYLAGALIWQGRLFGRGAY